MLTRACCHLCDEMAELLDAELPRYGLGWTPLEIDEHPDLAERYTNVVPVLLRDGKAVAKTRLDARQLRRIVYRRR